MGLAASQARFLAITARKANCEMQSMQIAQQKLGTTRDLQRAATEYQNSLDATKLVWAADDDTMYNLSYDVMMRPSTLNGFTPYLITDTNGKVVLSEQMFNAALNAGIIDSDGNPALPIKDGTRVTHSKPFMGAAATGAGSYAGYEIGSRNAFLEALTEFNQLSGAMKTDIMALGVDGYTRSGIGGPIFDKSMANALQVREFIQYMQKLRVESDVTVEHDYIIPCDVSKSDGSGFVQRSYTTTGADGRPTTITYDLRSGAVNKTDDNKALYLDILTYSAGQTIDRDLYVKFPAGTTAQTTGTVNGTTVIQGDTVPQPCTFKRGDIAPTAFEIAVEIQGNPSGYVYGVGDLFSNVFESGSPAGRNVESTVSSKFTTDGDYAVIQNGSAINATDLSRLTIGDFLSGQYEIVYKGSDSEAKYTELLKQLAKILGYEDISNVVGLNVDTESNEALTLAFGYTKQLLTSSNSTSESSKDPSELSKKAKGQTNVIGSTSSNISALSITNLLQSYLTNFARSIDGLGTSYYVDRRLTGSSNMVTNDYSYYFVVANDGAMKDEIDLNADFYNMLYNVISTTGACTNETLMNTVVDNTMLQEAIKNGHLFVSALNSDGFFYQGAYSLTDYIVEVTDEDAIARAEREYEVTKSRLNTKEETLELKMKNLDMEISSLTTEFDAVKNLISKNIEKVFTMFSS